MQARARPRQPRTCLRSWASQCTSSTVHQRWTTARWATFSKALQPRGRGAALMNSTAWCLRCVQGLF
eukprot:984627-Pelagomonas_calceolata.AAC.1